MGDRLTPWLRRLEAGWGHAAVLLGLLVLPGCNQIYGLDETQIAGNLRRGGVPQNYAILCDIESRRTPRRCATPDEVASGMFVPQSGAAVALTVRQTGAGNASLDYSEDARAACGGGPQLVTYEGAYPEGSAVCLKYLDVIGPGLRYNDANEVCAAWCKDLNGGNAASTPSEVQSFCNAHARASTNFPLSDSDTRPFGLGGFLGACSAEGVLQSDFDSEGPFIDPRRVSEALIWDPATLVGVTVDSTAPTVTRTAATTTQPDAGAASRQLITSGDGYVEFTAAEKNTRRIVGLVMGSVPNASPAFAHIDFGLELRTDGTLRVLENGTVKFTFGAYLSGQTFRIRVTDNHDSTATVTYSALMGSCVPGAVCAEQVFYTHTGATPVSYPFHVDSSLITQGATLTNVRLVRLQ